MAVMILLYFIDFIAYVQMKKKNLQFATRIALDSPHLPERVRNCSLLVVGEALVVPVIVVVVVVVVVALVVAQTCQADLEFVVVLVVVAVVVELVELAAVAAAAAFVVAD